MYKEKYHKYKNKHLKWVQEHGFTDPDNGDGYDEDNPDNVPDDELEMRDIPDDELTESLEDAVENDPQEFEGFNTGSTDDIISEDDLNQKVLDIGQFAKARGQSFDIDEFDKKCFIHLENKPNKMKILSIDDTNSFDDFTNKYGYIENNNIYIRWDEVSRKYKGVLIASSSQGERQEDDTIPYKGKTKPNWVIHDLKSSNLDKVLIFKKYHNLIHKKEIEKPFNGYVIDNYGVDEDEWTRITDTVTKDKVLFIDDIKAFDKFTKKYGSVKESDGIPYININWKKVKKDYNGISIDKDNYFETNRHDKAYFNDKLCDSWWERSNIVSGLAYLFR